MEILSLDPMPLATVSYLNAAPRSTQTVAGMRGVERTFLPIHQGRVRGLPPELEGLVITSDLQGRVKMPQTGSLKLLGEVLPEILAETIEVQLGKNSLRFGVVLAGDMFAVLHKRGGLGDVIPVWEAFRGEFKWVAGVAGNHDQFGETEADFLAFSQRSHVHLLDCAVLPVDGLRLAGIHGIIGTKAKPFRTPEGEFLEQIYQLCDQQPDMLVLHQGPDIPGTAAFGEASIREVIELHPPGLVVCGHVHWAQPLHRLPNGGQVLNADSRAFILLNADE